MIVHLILGSLVLSSGILWAYTSNFQRTTLYLGKKLAQDNPHLPTGMQDAITPEAQNWRNIISFLLLAGIFVYGIVFYRWYWSFGFILLIPAVSGITKMLIPKAGSDYYKQKIKQDLLKRRAKYANTGDAERKEAIGHILKQFDGLQSCVPTMPNGLLRTGPMIGK